MNEREFATFCMALKTYYPKEKNLLPNKAAMELWYKELKDIPELIISLALRKWVSTNEWSPTISDLRKKIVAIRWDAYEAITDAVSSKTLSEKEMKLYKWIYKQTGEFRDERFIEPPLKKLLEQEDMNALARNEVLKLE